MSALGVRRGPSWPWSYGSWIYNYLCNQCLSPLMLWIRISIRAICTTLCYKVCQLLATGRWFSPGPPVSSTNKTDRHDITEILLQMTLNTIKQTNKQTNKHSWSFTVVNISHFNRLLWNYCANNCQTLQIWGLQGHLEKNTNFDLIWLKHDRRVQFWLAKTLKTVSFEGIQY